MQNPSSINSPTLSSASRMTRPPAASGSEILPAAAMRPCRSRAARTCTARPYIDLLPFGEPWSASIVESLVQFKLVGDPYPGAFVQGHSMRQSESVARFASSSQEVLEESGGKTIITRLVRADGCAVEHRLIHREGDGAFEIRSSFTNGTSAPVSLEMLSSFSLAGITPFAAGRRAGPPARPPFPQRLERGRPPGHGIHRRPAPRTLVERSRRLQRAFRPDRHHAG